MSLAERKGAIMKNRLCYGCLRGGHQGKDCRGKHTCMVCKLKHPSLLHDYNKIQNNDSVNQQTQVKEQASSHNVDMCTPNRATTMIVPVLASHPSTGEGVLTYAMLDTQSNTHFVTKQLLNSLGVSGDDTTLDLTTMNGRVKSKSEVITDLMMKSIDSSYTLTLPKCFSRDVIPCSRSCISTSDSIKGYPHLSIINLPPYFNDVPVGLLLGYTCVQAMTPLDIVAGKEGEPFGYKTCLGWCVVGATGMDNMVSRDSLGVTHHKLGCNALRTHCAEIKVDVDSDGFRLSEIDCDDKFSMEDLKFLDIMNLKMHQCSDQHYESPLPFKSDVKFPNNRELALKRLSGLKAKFARDETYHKPYTTVMEETLVSGFAEVVTNQPHVSNKVWYIPHHGVLTPNKRVLFDCSAKFNNVSLNECLLQGPDLQNNILTILLRFRKDYVGITCDVQKMYHQFKVEESDRDLLRFLWWPKGDTSLTPVDHRMTMHLFGATSSPGVATHGLRKIAISHCRKYSIEARNFVFKNFYVDDGVASAQSDEEAYQLLVNTKGLLSEGGLKLHKIMSNSKGLMKTISVDDRATVASVHKCKTLGVVWDTLSDELCVPLHVEVSKCTRRGILSAVSSIYDPMGIIAPLILKAKLMLQTMCKNDCP